MYSIIRKLHLYSSFFLAAFILMYFVTGFIMIFEPDFKRGNIQEVRISEAISGVQMHPDSLIHWLRKEYDIHGQYAVRMEAQQAVVNFWHPGTVTEVKIPYPVDSVFITTKKGNIYTTLHQFHRLHGYQGGLNYYVWAFVYDLSASSMIVFALSGLYLWYKTERNRIAGWIVLSASTLLTAMTIIYLMFLS